MLMPKKLLSRLAFSALTLLAGCSAKQFQVQTGYDAHVDFGRLSNWDWAAPAGKLETPAATKTAERIQLDNLVKSHVRQKLKQKGFNQVTSQPDFLVAWSFGEWELDRHKAPNDGYGAVGLAFPGMHGSLIPTSPDGRALPPSQDPYSSKYEQAKLEFAVIDAKTAKVIWNATATDNTDFGYFTAKQRDRIGAAVDGLLEGFPPLAPGAP
jgi:hypothetical protein